MNILSILGSGWLGLPLAQNFIRKGFRVKASTTSENRLNELRSIKAEPFVLDIENLSSNIQSFLKTNVLIINIPSKNLEAYQTLLKEVENMEVEKVLFVSSTSVYVDTNKTISESDNEESKQSPFLAIENLFRNSGKFKTTVVRFGGLIGYSRNPAKFFRTGKLIQNPDANVNLIHRDDCIEIISRIVEHDVWGEVFNCCADTHPTKREFYTQAAQNSCVPIPEFAESGSQSFKIISNHKVKRILSYEFLHPDLMKIKF